MGGSDSVGVFWITTPLFFFCFTSPFRVVKTLPCFGETLQKKCAEVWKGGDSAALPDVSLHELKPVPDIRISLVLDQSGPGLGAVGTV